MRHGEELNGFACVAKKNVEGDADWFDRVRALGQCSRR